MLSAAYRCNRLYKYLYVDKLKGDEGPNDALVFGSAIHFALEEYFSEGINPVEAFRTYWDSEAPKIEFGRYGRTQLEDNAKVLLERFVKSHAKKISVYNQELRLFGTLHPNEGSTSLPIRVEGTPDLLGDFEGVPSVVDFKTAAYRYDKTKIQINEQMMLYAHLAKQNGYVAKQVVYIVFIKGNTPSIQTLTREIKDDEMDKVLENIRIQCEHLDRAQLENKFSYNSQSCQVGSRKCDFFERCWGKGEKNE